MTRRPGRFLLSFLTTILLLPVFGVADFEFTVFGDNRGAPGLTNVLAEIDLRLGGPGDFIIGVGDIDPPNVTQDQIYQQWSSNTVFYPCTGNHEFEPVDYMAWMRSKFDELPYIVNVGPTNGTNTSYSWDYGNAHFVMLNEYYDGISDTGTDGDVGDALYSWLVDDLAQNTNAFVFVIGHEPAFPQDDHDHGAGTARHVGDSLDQYPAKRDRFWQLLNSREVTAYFCGHTHRYSAIRLYGRTWHIDAGQAKGEGADQKYDTFLRVSVSSSNVQFNVWRDLNADGNFAVEHTWDVSPSDRSHVPHDFNGDSISDYGIFRPSSATWFISRSTDGPMAPVAFGGAGDLPIPADYDGDGRADFAVFRPPTSTWYIFGTSNGPVEPFSFGGIGDRPIPADYDGDGKADLAVFRPETVTWYVLGSKEWVMSSFVFGAKGDTPVPGDYDGDGRADAAVYRPSISTWYIHGSTDGPIGPIQYGVPGDLPVPGDYDGDGIGDIALFRPWTATWYVFGSSVGQMAPFTFGTYGDVPVR